MQALAKLHAELRAAQIETERLREQIKGRDAHIAELKGAIAARVGEFDKLRNELAAKNAELTALQAARNSELAAKDLALELKQRELEAMRDRVKVVATPDQGDDLKRIRGIGPGFEKILKQHGTTTYAQMAAWSGDDILRVATLLNTQPGRIARGAWIEQAAALLSGDASSI